MKFVMIFLAMVLVSCRPASEVVDKSTKTEVVAYRPGAKITVEGSDTGNSTPLITADASLICSDLSFYDPNGTLLQGTRDCSESLPECSEDGDTDCRATATYPAVPKAELETKIIAGESLAGVEGAATEGDYTNCSTAGQIGCVTTSAFTAMDKSLADSSTDLTASNFNATIASAGNFEFWDATGARHVLSGDTNLTAINIKDGVSLFGIAGSLTGAPPSCASDGEGSCLVDGTNYRAAATAGAASKILSGQSVAGIAGNVTLPAQGTVLTGTNYGVGGTGSSGTLTLPSAANVLSSAGNYGNPSSQITPTYSPDFPDLANVRAGDTVNGANGTLADCSSDGGVGCVVVGPSYAAALTTGAADKILSGQSIAGVNGNVTLPAVGKVLTGTSFGVSGTGSSGTLTLPDAGDVLTGSGTYGDPGSAVTPSYSPDFPDLANVRSSDTVNGGSGTLADCNAAGQAGCVATASYATMDLSSKDAGGALDLNATDFTTRITSASLFEYWDENGVRFTANGDADILATNIKSTVDIFGVSGSVAEAPANCSSNGSQSCVATGTYFAATACAANASNCFVPSYVATTQPLKAISYDAIDAGKGSIRTSLTLSDITGTLSDCSAGGSAGCVTTATYPSMNLSTTGGTGLTNANFATAVSSSSTYEFWDASGARHTVTGDTDLSVGNLKDGVEIHGVTGDYPSASYPLASNTGTTDLTSLGSGTTAGSYEFFDSTGARYATTVADGGTITPTASQQDFSGVSTVYNGFSVAGDADLVAPNIKSGTTIFGVAGSVNESPSNCSSNGSQSCVATGSYYAATACASNGADTCYLDPAGSYDAADLSNLSAGNIKRGITIAGTTGNFPSATSPLPRYSDTGATINTTGSDETDLTNFVTQLTSAGTFEFWDSSGVRRTGSGDADITDANVKSGVEFENLSITGNAAGAPCSYGAQGTCEADTACRWTGGACELNPWHIRKGITIGGQTGNITFYKNMVNTSVFNRTSGTGALAGADVFDTIDDYNNNGSFPTTAPGGWDQATGANWTEVVANDTYKDEITGLVWTDERGSFTWENAIGHCDGLTYGSRSDWRLPTQKELQQAYVNGIWSKKTELSLTTNWYWSASSQSDFTAYAWIVFLYYGFHAQRR